MLACKAESESEDTKSSEAVKVKSTVDEDKFDKDQNEIIEKVKKQIDTLVAAIEKGNGKKKWQTKRRMKVPSLKEIPKTKTISLMVLLIK